MKWLRILLFICALPTQAEIAVLDGLAFQPQERSQWCWAAVSAIAISGFDEQRAPLAEDDQFVHLTQTEVVARRLAKATNIENAKTRKGKIKDLKDECSGAGKCDSTAEPLLFDIDAEKPPRDMALSMAAFVDDIGTNKKPVVIRWGFANSTATHALIVTGYNTDANKLRIYDPLPLGSDPDGHEAWITYEQYLDPSEFKGKSIVPKHREEQYRMRRHGLPKPHPDLQYTLVSAPSTTKPARQPGGIEPEKLKGTIDKYIDKESINHAFLRSNGEPRTGTFTPGSPIPVIAIGAEQLNAPPESLLVRHAHAYVVPVFQGTEFVDSFQLLPENGGWIQGGYSSPKISSLLAKLSEDPKNKLELKQGEFFYLVSIPEVAGYYLAHGLGKDAMLKSLDYDGRDDFVPARKAFATLNEHIRRIAADRSARSKSLTAN